MSDKIVVSPETEKQLGELYRHIATATSPDVATRYTEAIVSPESLDTFPLRGTMRNLACASGFHHRRVLRRPKLRNDPAQSR
ncbi:hypothetical protein LPH50_00765 [Xylella taiwanensis]|uniref:Plasmid stabilization protein n=1 Tax=Xylella taiwanensis TaxID=1444770 RepID=A0ABS8TY35_9GAMM|nr:hypothetical protein [Xylella taiwanensis]MCD8456774.1 hypothetical protein [Xylella taiwanensis]MCD8459184.1 hypothetical protein [Xylella taiwanensis]MCD8461924.1 hypothetical protein [Xylella taiwanensis]MCD8464272.1 hypothetical protein [Xylella taiwanensis]MCD8465828.1 hypothetical protein [Xylella taiwanensis]